MTNIENMILQDMEDIDSAADAAASTSTYPTEEQKITAGYLPKPTCVSMSPPISIGQLRGDLKTIAIPIPKDFLLGDMHKEGKVAIYDSNGHNLLDHSYETIVRLAALENASNARVAALESESNARIAALESAIRMLAGGDKPVTCLEAAGQPEPGTTTDPAGQPEPGTITDGQPEPGTITDPAGQPEPASTEIVGELAENVKQILSMPLAKQYKIECKDIVLCPENQQEIAKFITGNATTMVKPFSIPAGIIACNEYCIIAVDKPTLQGQPGQLLAIFKDDYFDRAGGHYNPHTYDIYIEDATVISTELRPEINKTIKYACDMIQ
jgi:hypothetical protein